MHPWTFLQTFTSGAHVFHEAFAMKKTPSMSEMRNAKVDLSDEEKGFYLFDEPFVVPARIRHYIKMLQTFISFKA